MKTEGYKTIETGGYNEISRGGEHQKVETNGLGHIFANNIKYSHMTINSCGSSTKEYTNRKKQRNQTQRVDQEPAEWESTKKQRTSEQ